MEAKVIYELLRNNYAALQFAIYTCLLIKAQNRIAVPYSTKFIKDNVIRFNLHHTNIENSSEIDLTNGYKIRTDYAAFASETEKWEKFWLIQETALIAYVTQIIRIAFELKKTDSQFRKYFSEKLWKQNKDFFEILDFIRHVLIHNPDLIINTKESVSRWIDKQKGRILNFEEIITKVPDYSIRINFEASEKMIEWKNLFEIISIDQIYMLLELFMNIANEYHDLSLKISGNIQD